MAGVAALRGGKRSEKRRDERAVAAGGLPDRQRDLLATALLEEAKKRPDGLTAGWIVELLTLPDATRLPMLRGWLQRQRQELVAVRGSLEANKMRAENQIDADVAQIDAFLGGLSNG